MANKFWAEAKPWEFQGHTNETCHGTALHTHYNNDHRKIPQRINLQRDEKS